MVMDTPIRSAQGAAHLPIAQGASEGTNLIIPPLPVYRRLAHFPEEVYDLSPGTYLYRLMATLLGDAGVGQLRKRMVMARLQTTLQGTHFFDLDRFYGALLGAQRRVAERIEVDPYSTALTNQQWDQVYERDGSYRSRVEQFAKAIHFGASAIGMELIAEALLGVDCDVYESFAQADKTSLTHADLEAFTHAELEQFTHGELEGNVWGANPSFNRWIFTVIPKRPITQEERNDLMRVLRIFKPAQATLRVQSIEQSAFTDVPIRSVSADSEYWEIRSRVVSRVGVESGYVDLGTVADPKEQPRPPFSAYQGERWSYMGDVAGVMGYGERPPDWVDTRMYERVAFADGTQIEYLPGHGIRLIQESLVARAASDGIMASHYYSRSRGPMDTHNVAFRDGRMLDPSEISLSGVAPLYVDGMVIDDLVKVSEARLGLLRRQITVPQRFWSTPPLPWSDPTSESLEVRLRSERRVNYATFAVPHFPHRMEFQYWSEGGGTWVTLHAMTVNDSMPNVLRDRAEHSERRLHPQHSIAGHWIPIDLDLAPVYAKSFRVRMRRIATGTHPVTSTGAVADYSLGVKNFEVGYRIRKRDDIPRLKPRGSSEIGNTIDLLGSRVSFSIREKPAPNAIDGNPEVAWLSEPQPIGSAVVNFYMDVRNAAGNGQIIDNFYLDPVKPGPLLNLYYSDQEVKGRFDASDRILSWGEVATTGTYQTVEDGIAFDSGDPTVFEVDNSYLQFFPGDDWALGMHVRPRYSAAEATQRPLIAFGGYSAVIDQGSLVFTSTFGDNYTVPIDFQIGTGVKVVVGYERRRRLVYMQAQTVDGTTERFEANLPQTITSRVDSVRIGGGPNDDGVANFLLRGLVLKQHALIDPEDYFEHTSAYSTRAEFAHADDHRTDNALLRFHRDYVGGDSALGLVGGPGDFYSDLIWSPIPRDFTLQKGFISLPPIQAKFWKFEFSNLTVQPYEVYSPMQRRIRLFPPKAIRDSINHRTEPGTDMPGHAIAVANAHIYADSPRSDLTMFDPTKVLPTSSLYSEEPSGSQRLREMAWAFGFVPWHIGVSNPGFRERGAHRYDEITFQHDEKIAFFVGLREIRAHRINYRAKDDPEAIIDRYWNAALLRPGGTFTLNPGRLTSANRTFAEIESSTFRSRHAVLGVQYATQQTDAVQLIPDDDFRDRHLTRNEWTNNDTWHRHGDAILYYLGSDQSVLMSRDVEALASLDPYTSGIIADPIHPVFAQYNPAHGGSQEEGGIESALVRVSPEGMVHGAARITALTDLTNPLWVQIVDINGTVLAERSVQVSEGDTAEVTVAYVLGSYNDSYVPSLDPRSIIEHPVHPVFAGYDPLDDHGPGPYNPGHLFRVRLIQKGVSKDVWKVDRLSLFDESITWEFSNNGGETWVPAHGIRNNPEGILSFSKGGSALRYRLRAYRANMNINAIQIRPRYADLPTLRLAMTYRGPNVSAYDQYPPIQDDPEFKRWKHPVPRWWWLEGQRFGELPIEGYPYSNEFSRGYIRQAEDDIGGITDEATRTLWLNRPTEFYLDVTEVADRQMEMYRSISDEIGVFTMEAWANIFHDGTMPHQLPWAPPQADEPYIGDGDFETRGSDEDWSE
jgi:hypothetical protein